MSVSEPHLARSEAATHRYAVWSGLSVKQSACLSNLPDQPLKFSLKFL